MNASTVETDQGATVEQSLETQASTLETQAAAIAIRTPEDRDKAAEFAKGVRALRDQAEAHHRPIIQSAHQTWKLALEALNRVDQPLARAETKIKSAIGAWDMDQDRLHQEAQRRLEEEAKRRRDEEALAAALAVEERGASTAEADAVLEETMAAPIELGPMRPAVRSGGVPTRKVYKAKVVDLVELLKYVIANPSMQHLVTANESALNKLAGVQKELFNIPGCRVAVEASVAIRR